MRMTIPETVRRASRGALAAALVALAVGLALPRQATAIVEVFSVPNPASGPTRIRYVLDKAATTAVVKIYDTVGRRVRTFTGTTAIGANTVVWPLDDERGSLVANGIYHVWLDVDTPTGHQAANTKVAVMR